MQYSDATLCNIILTVTILNCSRCYALEAVSPLQGLIIIRDVVSALIKDFVHLGRFSTSSCTLQVLPTLLRAFD